MTGQDAAEIRRVLRNHGHQVKDRGKLSADSIKTYEEIMADEYSGGVTEADFDPRPPAGDDTGLADLGDVDLNAAPLPPGDPGSPEAGEPVAAERKPRPASQPAAGRARSFLGRGRGQEDAPKKPRRRRRKSTAAWMPTGPVIERLWGELAWSARKMPPVQRVMAAQAPMVGVVLEGTARNTIVDRHLLQPLARGEEKLEAVNAVFGPLLWTGMIMRFGGFDVEPVLQEGRPVLRDGVPVVRPVIEADTGQPAWNDQTRVMIGGLRFSLMSWLRVGQRHAAEIIERAEELDELGDQADALIAFILSPPKPRQSFKDLQREARQRAGIFLHDETTGEPDHPGDGEPGMMRPEPAAAGHAPDAAAAGYGSHPYPPAPPAGVPVPDPRMLGFMPPDPAVASQVVPRAALPQA